VTVALEGERIAGFLAANAESVSQLHVRVGCHGRGIGRELLHRAMAASVGSLWLYTFARNERARRFYERNGFAAVAFGYEPFWQLEDVRYEWRRSQ
jgi:ribosomal protein S18 acetylase RimI-like enzyme